MLILSPGFLPRGQIVQLRQSSQRWMQLVSTHTNFHLINLRKKEDKKLSIVRGSAELAAAFKEVEAAVLKVYA